MARTKGANDRRPRKRRETQSIGSLKNWKDAIRQRRKRELDCEMADVEKWLLAEADPVFIKIWRIAWPGLPDPDLPDLKTWCREWRQYLIQENREWRRYLIREERGLMTEEDEEFNVWMEKQYPNN
jgi:hypothetical protein